MRRTFLFLLMLAPSLALAADPPAPRSIPDLSAEDRASEFAVLLGTFKNPRSRASSLQQSALLTMSG